MNLIPGKITGDVIDLNDGSDLPIPDSVKSKISDGPEIVFGFSTDYPMPTGHGMAVDCNFSEFDMRVDLSEPLGTETLIFGSLAGREVRVKMMNPHPIEDGETMKFCLDLGRCHLFDAKAGMAES